MDIEASRQAVSGLPITVSVLTSLRELDQRQKQVLSLFSENKYITTREISELLGVHKRTALNLCNKWREDGFIIQHGQANKSRKYELATKWLELL